MLADKKVKDQMLLKMLRIFSFRTEHFSVCFGLFVFEKIGKNFIKKSLCCLVTRKMIFDGRLVSTSQF